jgi:hypothetical protein
MPFLTPLTPLATSPANRLLPNPSPMTSLTPRNTPHIAWPQAARTDPSRIAPPAATAIRTASAVASTGTASTGAASIGTAAPRAPFTRAVFARSASAHAARGLRTPASTPAAAPAQAVPAQGKPATPHPTGRALPAFLRHAAGLLLIAALLLFVIRPARAGQACNDVQLNAEQIRASLNLALKTREALEASGAQVAMVARAGQDLSRHGLRYSHLGWAWRDHPKGRWFVVHELNACGTAASELYDEGLGNFFLTDLVSYEALIVIPPPEAQAKIAGRLAREPALALHQPRYNMVAHPFSTKYQNSNQWGMETLAAALAPEGSVADRAGAQAWLRQNGFTPTTLQLSTLTRLGGRMFRANVAFDDHPDERRYAGRIDTTTVEAAAAFLQARGAKSQTLSVPAAPMPTAAPGVPGAPATRAPAGTAP